MSRRNDLELLDPGFRDQLRDLLERLAPELPTLRVFESIRSPERQTELYARGRDPDRADYGRTVTRARAYQSAHQFGLAADLVFVDGRAWTWEEPESGAWDRMHELARDVGLVPLSIEKPHVQVAGFDWRALERGPVATDSWLAWLAGKQQQRGNHA